MTPLDDELRTALHQRADSVAPLPDPLARIEAQAKRIHRRRVASAVAGSTMTVAVALAIAIPLATGGGGHPRGVSGGGGPTLKVTAPSIVTTAPSAVSTLPSAAPTTSATPQFTIADPTTWGFKGNAGLRDAHEQAATAAWSTATKAGTTPPTTLLATTDADGDVVLVLAAPMTGAFMGHTEVGVYVQPPHGPAIVTSLHDQDPKWGAVTAKYDGPTGHHWGLVVGAPTTGEIEYQPYRSHYRPIGMHDGWAVFDRSVDSPIGRPQDFVRVLDGDGDFAHPLYEGAIGRGWTFPDA